MGTPASRSPLLTSKDPFIEGSEIGPEREADSLECGPRVHVTFCGGRFPTHSAIGHAAMAEGVDSEGRVSDRLRVPDVCLRGAPSLVRETLEP